MNNIGYNLKRIRLLKKMSLKEASKILNMSAPAVCKYEKGLIIPNSTKIIEFAKAYNVKTTEILKSYKEPKIKFNSFRKKRNINGQKLELLKQTIKEEVAKYFEVLSMCDIAKKKNNLKNYDCYTLDDAENIAYKFRSDYNLTATLPVSNLINVLENLGIIIISIKNLDYLFEGFDGFSEIIEGLPVIVILDGQKDGTRQRFTISHELGHLILNIQNKDMEEKLVNRFASALLMPEEAIKKEFGTQRGSISFYELEAFKNEYKVSFTAIIHRLKDLNIISNYLYKNLTTFFNKDNGLKDKNPIMPEKSYQFKRLVCKLEAENIITLNKACELLDVTINEYNQENYNYWY